MNHSVLELAARATALACLSVAVQAQQRPLRPVQDLTVTYSVAGLTIRADQIELDALLAAIGDRLGIAIVMPPMEARRVSFTFEGEPVPEVLRRVLRGRSYVLSYAQPWTGSIEDSPNRLWILPSDAETASQPLNWSEERSGSIPAPGPNENTSIEDAIAFAEGDETSLVSNLSSIALGADEARVRERAVFALGDLGNSIGFTAIQKALQDPSPVVREAAIVNLSGIPSPSVIASLEQALEDEDPSVRQAAEDVLEEALWQE